MDKRIAFFNVYFAKWGIGLPANAEERFPKGTIICRGWDIKFIFGEDEEGKYLDFYACNRMTNDRHWRLRDNGDGEPLPALPDVFMPRIPEYEDRVAKLLKAKGFAYSDECGILLEEDDLLKPPTSKQMTTIS